MRLLIAHTPVPSYLSCVLMAIRSSKSKSTDIFPIFRESYLKYKDTLGHTLDVNVL